jgi:hypothetical protein
VVKRRRARTDLDEEDANAAKQLIAKRILARCYSHCTHHTAAWMGMIVAPAAAAAALCTFSKRIPKRIEILLKK